jgi:hypothetical protein
VLAKCSKVSGNFDRGGIGLGEMPRVLRQIAQYPNNWSTITSETPMIAASVQMPSAALTAVQHELDHTRPGARRSWLKNSGLGLSGAIAPRLDGIWR